jgi:hypothetical protein
MPEFKRVDGPVRRLTHPPGIADIRTRFGQLLYAQRRARSRVPADNGYQDVGRRGNLLMSLATCGNRGSHAL